MLAQLYNVIVFTEPAPKSIRSYFDEDLPYVMDAKTSGNLGRYLNVCEKYWLCHTYSMMIGYMSNEQTIVWLVNVWQMIVFAKLLCVHKLEWKDFL